MQVSNVPFLNHVVERCKSLLNDLSSLSSISIEDLFGSTFEAGDLSTTEQNDLNDVVKNFYTGLFGLLNSDLTGVADDLKEIIKGRSEEILDEADVDDFFSNNFDIGEVIIPNEPWTPVIKEMSIDYKATATITDIDLIHLYPYTGTYKPEEFEILTILISTFCDEGNLYLGIEDLQPGSNLHVLFQLAEATADSESEKEDVQ